MYPHDMELSSLPKTLHKSVLRLTRERQNLTKSCDQLAQQVSEEEAKLRTTLDKLESLNEKLTGLTNAHALSEEAISALGDARTRAGYGWYKSNSNNGGGGSGISDSSNNNKAVGKHGGKIGALLLKKIEAPRKMTLAEHCKISSTINQIRAFTTQADTERMNVIELKQRLESLEQVLGRAERPLPSEPDQHDVSDSKSMCYLSIRRKPVPNTYSRSDDDLSKLEQKRRDSRIVGVDDDDDDDDLPDSISIDSTLPGRWPDEKERKDTKTSLEDYFAVRGVGVFLLVWFMVILTFLSAR